MEQTDAEPGRAASYGSPGGAPTASEAELERVTLSKVGRRLLPFMFILYVFAMLDRVNINSAVLTMKPDLGFNSEVLGIGAGIFFAGYFFFEVPSNILLERFGARRWIARITFTWGIIASALMFVNSPLSFYAIRFTLGVAEAGFFPGMVLYLSQWFPNSVRGRASVKFMIAGTVVGIVGGPLAAQLMKLNGLWGLRGWQWLFLLEGIPSFLMGFVVLAYMTDRPEEAHWLKPEERDWLVRKMATEHAHRRKHHSMSLMQAFAYPRVLHLSAIWFLQILAGSGLGLFGNLILKQRSDWNDSQVLWLSALPPIVGAISMLVSAAHSDRTGERRLHVSGGLAVALVGLLLVASTRSPVLTLVGIAVMQLGTAAANGPYWALVSGFLSGAAAAGGIAFINSIANSGSFFGPFLMGYIESHVHHYEPALYLSAAILAAAAVVAYLLPHDPAQDTPVLDAPIAGETGEAPERQPAYLRH